MTVADAFRGGWTALKTNPLLVLVGIGIALIEHVPALTAGIGQGGIAILGPLVWFLAFPFLLGGFVGMALPAVRGVETSLTEFVRSGQSHYVRLLGASVLYLGIVIGPLLVAFTLSIPLALVAAGTVGLLGGDGPTMFKAVLPFFIGSPLIAVGIGLVLSLLAQFYVAAIVIEDKRIREAFRRSVTLVRENLESFGGFAVAWGSLSTTVLAAEYQFAGFVSQSRPPQLPVGAIEVQGALLTGVSILYNGLVFAYLYTVYTAFYVRLSTDTRPETLGNPGSAN